MKTLAKSLVSLAALAAVTGFAGDASAEPGPGGMPKYQLQSAAMPPWSRDDGSSSDHPVPMPSDHSANALNSQYRDGIPVAPPNGFPAPYRVR